MASAFPLDLMDDASAALILKMQSQDMEELLEGKKGKAKEAEFSDADVAFNMFQEHIREMSMIIADRKMSRSITKAVITDAVALTESLAEEQCAADDRAVAQRLSAGIVQDPPTSNQASKSSKMEESLVARLFGLYVTPLEEMDAQPVTEIPEDDESDGCPVAENSSWAASRQARVARATYHCVSCDSVKHLFELLGAPCGHYYCEECLRTLFRLSTSDETLFPPRCCRRPIPLASARLYLDSDLIKYFQKKSVEFRSSNRTYCFRPSCSVFIPPSSIEGDRGTCPVCSASTCTICKNGSHAGDCPEDSGTQQMLEMANQEGWQRCFKCRRLVELNHGCNHMRCICNAEFCYICGCEWKTCVCDQWDERRLYARAEQVIEREEPLVQPVEEQAQEVRNERLDQAMEQLRQHHDCGHERWRWVNGRHQCEECFHMLPQYIFECRQCRILACNRCRRNRL